jgi:hypothetical protein
MIACLWNAFACRFLGRKCEMRPTTSRDLRKDMQDLSEQVDMQTVIIRRQRNLIQDALQGRIPPDRNVT